MSGTISKRRFVLHPSGVPLTGVVEKIKKKLSRGLLSGQQPPSEPEQPLPQDQSLQQSQSQTQAKYPLLFGHIRSPADLEKEIKGQGSSTTSSAANPPTKATPKNGITPL